MSSQHPMKQNSGSSSQSSPGSSVSSNLASAILDMKVKDDIGEPNNVSPERLTYSVQINSRWANPENARDTIDLPLQAARVIIMLGPNEVNSGEKAEFMFAFNLFSNNIDGLNTINNTINKGSSIAPHNRALLYFNQKPFPTYRNCVLKTQMGDLKVKSVVFRCDDKETASHPLIWVDRNRGGKKGKSSYLRVIQDRPYFFNITFEAESSIFKKMKEENWCPHMFIQNPILHKTTKMPLDNNCARWIKTESDPNEAETKAEMDAMQDMPIKIETWTKESSEFQFMDITEKGEFQKLFTDLKSNKNLKSLSFNNSGYLNIYNRDMKELAEVLNSNPRMQSFVFYEERAMISKSEMNAFSEAIKNHQSLISLKFGGFCGTSSESIIDLAKALEQNKTITHCDFTISQDGFKALAEMMKINQSIVEFKLRDSARSEFLGTPLLSPEEKQIKEQEKKKHQANILSYKNQIQEKADRNSKKRAGWGQISILKCFVCANQGNPLQYSIQDLVPQIQEMADFKKPEKKVKSVKSIINSKFFTNIVSSTPKKF